MADDDNKGCGGVIAVLAGVLLSGGLITKGCGGALKALFKSGDNIVAVGAKSADDVAGVGATATHGAVHLDEGGALAHGLAHTDDASRPGFSAGARSADDFGPNKVVTVDETSADVARLIDQTDQPFLQSRAARSGTETTIDTIVEHADPVDAVDLGLNAYDYWKDDSDPNSLAASEAAPPPQSLPDAPWSLLPAEAVTSDLVVADYDGELPAAVVSPHLVAVVPDRVLTYRKVFGALPDQSSLSAMQTTVSAFSTTAPAELISDSVRKRQFLRFLTDGPDDANTAIVFAFAQGSEEGAPPSEFRLLSGETINIREMQYACLDEEVQCILIICRPDKALAGVQAARMIDTAIKTYTSAAALDRAMPMRRFVELLRTQRSSLKAEHITITVLSPGPNGNAAYSITSQLGTFD